MFVVSLGGMMLRLATKAKENRYFTKFLIRFLECSLFEFNFFLQFHFPLFQNLLNHLISLLLFTSYFEIA
jgi:hypothetical protein